MRILRLSNALALAATVSCSASPVTIASSPREAPSEAAQLRFHPEPVALGGTVGHTSNERLGAAPDGDWPPLTYDHQKWVGPLESTIRYLPGPASQLFSEVGCPFQPAALPACDDSLVAADVEQAVKAASWSKGAIVTVKGVLRLGALQTAEEKRDPVSYGRGVVGLELCGAEACLDLFSNPNQQSFETFSEYWCLFDNSGVCCGFQYNLHVIARGRVTDWVGPALEKPLLCAVAPHAREPTAR